MTPLILSSPWEIWLHEQLFCYYRLMIAHRGNRSATTAPTAAQKELLATYQTRICHYQGMDPSAADDLLSAFAHLYTRKERRLFAQVASGRSTVALKREYLRRYRIPARMFNGVRLSLEGKVASVREQQQ